MLLVLLLLVRGLQGQQCSGPADCPSVHAPHCSRWGWCQWTDQYGQSGPAQGELPSAGYCNSNRDCVPRAPFCSRQGYCTQRPVGRVGPQGDVALAAGVALVRGQAGSLAGGHARTPARGHARALAKGPQEAGRRSGQAARPEGRAPKTEGRAQHSRPGRPGRGGPGAGAGEEEPRSRGVLPSGTFLLMNSGFGQRQSPVPGPRPEPRPAPRAFTPRPAPTPVPRPLPAPAPRRPAPEPVFQPETGQIDRQDYNYYDAYDYYEDFEVQKTQPAETPARQEPAGRGLEPILEHPAEGQSQGCLYDCVYDCVSISQLAAYRDCVDFCGKTCNN